MNDLATQIGRILAEVATATTSSALNTDAALRARLQALAGRCIEIQCTAPPVTWHLTITDEGIETKHGPAPAAQVSVRGRAIDLASWLIPGESSTHVNIDGDETLLLEIIDMLRDFNPDFAASLGKIVGADAAATLLGTAEMGLKALRSLLQGVGVSVQQQVSGNFVQPDHLDALLSGIDELRLRVDRLAAKVSQRERSAQHTGTP